jgi:DNA (cytosine-5)-methyltransferase 1
MWPEVLRIVGEVSPRFVFTENVDEGAIINAQYDLSRCGYETIRGMVAAGDMGADHPRERWWMVADANNKSKLGGKVNAEMAVIEASGKGFWETSPVDLGISDGMANRMDRYIAAGQGQVPAVVRLAWEILKPAA